MMHKRELSRSAAHQSRLRQGCLAAHGEPAVRDREPKTKQNKTKAAMRGARGLSSLLEEHHSDQKCGQANSLSNREHISQKKRLVWGCGKGVALIRLLACLCVRNSEPSCANGFASCWLENGGRASACEQGTEAMQMTTRRPARVYHPSRVTRMGCCLFVCSLRSRGVRINEA